MTPAPRPAQPSSGSSSPASNLQGIRLMVLSSAGFSVMALCVKLASPAIPSLELVFFRSLFGLLMMLGVMLPRRISLTGVHHKLMALRGISGFLALSLYFTTLGKLPLGTAVILNYTSPVLSALLAVFFLKERPGWLLALLTLFSFAGVYLLVGGSFAPGNLYVWTGLLSAVFAAGAYVFIRAVRERENPMTIIFYFTAISTAGSLFYLPFGFVWPEPHQWLYLLGIGVGSFYGQLWMTLAFQKAPATVVSPFFYVSPILSYFYGFLLLGDPLSLRAVAGVLLIVASGSLIAGLEARKSGGLPDD